MIEEKPGEWKFTYVINSYGGCFKKTEVGVVRLKDEYKKH
jgi:hypothetical protein